MASDANYTPQQMTQDPKALQRYLANEFNKIKTSIQSLQEQVNANLTKSESASNLTSGTIPYARIPIGAYSLPGETFSYTSSGTAGTVTYMGGSGTFTPLRSGRILVITEGYLTATKTTVAGGGLFFSLYLGTGTAPASGSATPGSGTGFGGQSSCQISTVGTGTTYQTFPTVMGPSPVLTVGATYWVDMACRDLTNASNVLTGAIYYMIIEL